MPKFFHKITEYFYKEDCVYPDAQKTTGMPVDEWASLGSGFRPTRESRGRKPVIFNGTMRMRVGLHKSWTTDAVFRGERMLDCK